ncbi:MAG: TIGR04076 family protein [Eubacteriales bacterium]|nr:TIGR04076 family protein [Eubacteriales bacterium]
MGKCRITVIKKMANVEIQKEYMTNPAPEGTDPTCDAFQVGQVFDYENGGPMPEGFCPWAWGDLNRDIEGICAGANFSWIKDEKIMISCCTDGTRPVIFKIERID